MEKSVMRLGRKSRRKKSEPETVDDSKQRPLFQGLTTGYGAFGELNMQRTLRSVAFSARAFSSKSHVPPLKIAGINGRYAGALYSAASKAGSLDAVENELKAFTATLTKSPDFAAYLANPNVSRNDKTAKLSALLKGGKFSSISSNLFVILSANGRISEADKVVGHFIDQMEASRGLVNVVVTTAEPLNKKTMSTVQSAVSSIVGKDAKIDLKVKEDASILGGLQILVGDKFLDLSVANRVNQLSATLESA